MLYQNSERLTHINFKTLCHVVINYVNMQDLKIDDDIFCKGYIYI